MNGSTDGWLKLAEERSRDAESLECQDRSLAAVYILGYAVECSLKACMRTLGKKPPTSGQEGHHLSALLEQSGFKRHDVPGPCRAFLDQWAVDLRYRVSLPPGVDKHMLLMGGRKLIDIVSTQVRRRRARR